MKLLRTIHTKLGGEFKVTINESGIRYDLESSNNINNLKSAELTNITNRIQRNINLNSLSTFLCWLFFLLFLYYVNFGMLFMLIISLGFKIIIHTCGYINLNYNFDQSSPQCISAFKKLDIWNILGSSKQIWYIHAGKSTSASNSDDIDFEHNMKPTRIDLSLPHFLRSNIQLPVIRMKKAKKILFFLPDCVLLIHRKKATSIKYEDLFINIYSTEEICPKAPAKDCTLSKSVWLYANKDGSPDKRYKDNRQLPVYNIGRIDISSKNGFHTRLAISNINALKKFKIELDLAKKIPNIITSDVNSTPKQPSQDSPDRSMYGISPEEIDFLEYASGHDSDIATFSEKFFYLYGINYDETISFLISNDYIIIGNAEEALDLYTLPELKNFLRESGLPLSGTKPVLIQRIIENSNEYGRYFTKRKFELTDKGKNIINKYKTDHGIPVMEKENYSSEFKKYSELARTHMQEGNLGLYASDIYLMSEVYRKEQYYNDQLEALMMSAYAHLSGIGKIHEFDLMKSNHFKYAKPHPMLPSAVIRSTDNVMKELKMDISTYKTMFKETIEPAFIPDHVFGIDKSLEIICLYLNGEHEKAEEEIEKGTQEFISRYK